VLIAGGGVAGLETLLALGHLTEGRARIELLAPERDFIYRPLTVAEPFGSGHALRFDLGSLVAEQGALYRPDALASVDPAGQLAHTRAGHAIRYGALVVACGAASREALPGALTFWGIRGGSGLVELLNELEGRGGGDVVFALPAGPGWPLPLYELALLTRTHLDARGAGNVRLTVATHEASPLELFGARASQIVAAMLEERRIGVRCGCYPAAVDDRGLLLVPGGHLAADRVVAVPRPEGRRIPGLPHDEQGFIPTDVHGRVHGLEHVYAAGDGTSFPIKQGGIAAQQADAAAESIAARAGGISSPAPFYPVLRGLLLTGGEPAYLRAELGGGRGESSSAESDALWWPPGKIAGKHLAPHLAALAGTQLHPPPPDNGDSIPVEVELRDGAPVLH
jgi:sulfide:quinone oxidoreductase